MPRHDIKPKKSFCECGKGILPWQKKCYKCTIAEQQAKKKEQRDGNENHSGD